MNLYKKLKFYFQFRKTVRRNRKELLQDFNIRVDFADRLYTVVNVPDTLGEPYNMRKSDLDRVAETYLKEYIVKLSSYLNSIGLGELYDYYQPIKKLDKFSYLIIIGYKPISSTKISAVFWYLLVPTISIGIVSIFYQFVF